MSKLTKAQLVADLEASHVAYQHISTINESLSAECMALRTECNALQEQLRESQLLLLSIKRAVPIISATTPWREAAAKAKAKTLAMQTGRSVLVG